MATRIDLAEATPEWLATFKARFNFLSSFVDDPKMLPRHFLSDALGISCEEVRLSEGRVVILASDISRAAMVALMDAQLVHEGVILEAKHFCSVGDLVQEYGNEWVEHRIEVEFRAV